MPVTGNYSVGLEATNQSTSDSEEASVKIGRSLSGLFADGTGAGQVNKIWQDIRPLTDGGNETLDFNPTLPASGLSGAVAFTAIKAILIWAPATNTTNITITGTLLTMGDPLKPGGVKFMADPSAAGMLVTATTKDTLVFTNSAGAVANYGIVVVGI